MSLKLPRGADAEVPRLKVVAYLLSPSHPVGSAKARYFVSRGYSAEEPEAFEDALAEIARSGTVESTQAIEWGTKYVVAGSLIAPDGDPIELATVWIVRGDAHPVLVTAYPWRGQDR